VTYLSLEDHSLRDLTDEIRRLGTYPVASGGFSDIYKGARKDLLMHLVTHPPCPGLLPDHERSTVRVVGIKVIRAVSHSRGVLKKIEKVRVATIGLYNHANFLLSVYILKSMSGSDCITPISLSSLAFPADMDHILPSSRGGTIMAMLWIT
jgi:hypothetical protein